MPNVREPQKVTSIDKKNRIIEAGLKIFGEVGYYNTNTAEIAKEAGVSTGIVYNYFNDKKDILMYAIEVYFDNITKSFIEAFDKVEKNYQKGSIFSQLIPIAFKQQEDNINLHRQMLGLSYLDKDIRDAFLKHETLMINKIYEFASKLPISQNNLKTKANLSYQIMECLCEANNFHKENNIEAQDLEKLGQRVLDSLFID